jgi:hypothetical protein
MSNFRCIKVAKDITKCILGNKNAIEDPFDGLEKQDAFQTRYDICMEKFHADAVKYCGVKSRFLLV